MPHLLATTRYDQLRIAIPEDAGNAHQFARLQDEFTELLEALPYCETVIVDLAGPATPSNDVVELLARWQRITQVSGRRFRINGPNRVVSYVMHHKTETLKPVYTRQRQEELVPCF